MAQRVETFLVDDIDGTEAGGTVSFGLDGARYEIDLSDAHSQKLHDLLEPYLRHARRARSSADRPARPARNSAGREKAARIREWAREEGIEVNDRGRIPASVAARYDAARQ